MELTVLGSGTAVPDAARGAPGYVVRAGGELLLLECGAGSVDRMVRAGIDPRALDRVILSHHHIDHFGEIGHLLFGARLPVHGRTRPLTLAGSARLLEIFSGYRAPFGSWLEPESFALSLHDLDAAPLAGAGYTLTGHRVAHIDSSRAVRIRDDTGVVLAYSGDTDVCPGVVEAARDADLFLVEASFPEAEKRPGHLVATEAGRLGREAGARRLLLTHFYPEWEGRDPVAEAGQEFPGEVLAATDGMRIQVDRGES